MTTDRSLRVNVVGLKEVQKALKSLETGMAPAELRKVNLEAARLIAARAQAAASGAGGVAGHVIDGISAVAQQLSAGVKLDAGKAPAIFGAEFGGGRFKATSAGGIGPKSVTGSRPGYTSQFQPWRGNGGDAGYFLYPTVRSSTNDVRELYGRLIDQLIARI